MKITANKNHKADVFLKPWMKKNIKIKIKPWMNVRTTTSLMINFTVWQAPEVPRDFPN